MDLKNKVVLITGSSSGIGKATALMFAKEGVKIIINYKSNKKGAEETASEIKNSGGDVSAIQTDITDPIQVKKLFALTVQKFGTLDVLINNAGLTKPKPFLEITQNDLISDFHENFFSTVFCCQEAVKIMLKNKRGKIINCSSTAALTGFKSVVTYSAAKASVITFTKSLAKLYAPKILVNAVAPGYTLTRYWDTASDELKKESIEETLLKKMVTPEEIAETYLYLAKNDSITGQTIVVDAGYTVNL